MSKSIRENWLSWRRRKRGELTAWFSASVVVHHWVFYTLRLANEREEVQRQREYIAKMRADFKPDGRQDDSGEEGTHVPILPIVFRCNTLFWQGCSTSYLEPEASKERNTTLFRKLSLPGYFISFKKLIYSRVLMFIYMYSSRLGQSSTSTWC